MTLIHEQEKYIQALVRGDFHKLIIGAALKDYEMIEHFSYLFTAAEADAIDISAFPHSVLSATNGMNAALAEDPSITKPLLMISVNIGEDPHFRRIELDTSNCTECLACIPTCPSNAFNDNNGQFQYNPDLCFGCSNCLPACHFDALSFDNWSPFSINSLQDLAKLGADAIEIHLNQDLTAFTNFYKDLAPDLFKLESFCIGSTIASAEELIDSADLVIKNFYRKYPTTKSFILQVDGEPLSGARFSKDEAKDQISIAKAKIIINHIEERHPAYRDMIFVQVAGGITENTLAKARSQNVAINGVAIGSYARKFLDNQRREQNLDVPQLKVSTKDLLARSKNTENKAFVLGNMDNN